MFSESSYTTTSVIVIHQLEDKLKALEYFCKFLQNTGLWEKVSSCLGLHWPYTYEFFIVSLCCLLTYHPFRNSVLNVEFVLKIFFAFRRTE